EIYLAPQRITSFCGDYPVFTLSQDCPTGLALEHIKRVQPSILTGFPSYFLRMSKENARPEKLSIEAICTNSEASTEQERQLISAWFGAPVFDEYSSEELYLIATQCEHGRYHLVEDNVRVDVYRPDSSGLGEVVGTSLTNFYMPFIKYRQGDLA